MVTTHTHPPPPQHTAVGAGGRWWWCGLFLGWVWCSETPRSVVPSPLPLHTPSSRPSYVPPPPVSLAPNTHTHTHPTSLPVRVLLVVCVPSLPCASLFSSDSPLPPIPLARSPPPSPRVSVPPPPPAPALVSLSLSWLWFCGVCPSTTKTDPGSNRDVNWEQNFRCTILEREFVYKVHI